MATRTLRHHPVFCSRETSIWASRAVAVLLVTADLALYFVLPGGLWGWVGVILLHTYLRFLCGVMAHEAVHGHMGRTRQTNLWWGRLALMPTNVPYVNFRLTHTAHHRATNVPGEDPDEFLNTQHGWQVPLRAWLMAHQWVLWLHAKRKLSFAVWMEWLGTYVVYLFVYGFIASQVGWERVVFAVLGATTLHAFLLWYPFAIKTHEGYSRGDEWARSHDYLGAPLFWATLGLSLHRVHHLRPDLGWLQTRSFVTPCSWRDVLRFRRDVRHELGAS